MQNCPKPVKFQFVCHGTLADMIILCECEIVNRSFPVSPTTPRGRLFV